jgi:hypothetical protein
MGQHGTDPAYWNDLLERTLRRYDEGLLRRVAGRLLRPRNQWPIDDLISRHLATIGDVTIIERRLKDLEPAERRLLALMRHSRQPHWSLGSLVESMIAMGEQDGLKPVFALLEAGLLYPLLPGIHSSSRPSLKSFDQWLTGAGSGGLEVFAHPMAMQRAIGEDMGLGALDTVLVSGPVMESDGLDWLLRLAVLWQQIGEAPLRRTQQGDFFKRDLDRLDNDPLLKGPSEEGLPLVPDAPYLAVLFASETGMVEEREGELVANSLPTWLTQELPGALAGLWQSLPRLREWTPLDGWSHGERAGNPFISAGMLAFLLLAELPEKDWTTPQSIQDWIQEHHPFWTAEGVRPSRQRDWTSAFLLGLGYQLRMVQAARTTDGTWAVRLSPTGRWMLGLASQPPSLPSFPRTLLVQPNLEIIAYRQGLTPNLIAFLARLASWRSLGGVCLLQLGPDSVYRGLESGLTFDEVVHTLDKHGTRPTPAAVIDSLRTWAQKRDRITIYPAGALLEFATREELDAALARGCPAVRISDCVAVVPGESSIDYSMFRLISSRDYSARPEQCVEVADDGLTLIVDVTRSDLLLESELTRFAIPLDRPGNNGRRRFQMTPASLGSAREGGMTVPTLDAWFQQRVGSVISPAATLLLTGCSEQPPVLRRHLVLEVPTESVADGLMQWPASRQLISERLGPTALSVLEENVVALSQVMSELGVLLPPAASAGEHGA